MEQKNFSEAAKAFECAHDADAAILTPRLHAGDLLLRQKKFVEARDVYDALLKETNILSSTERLRFGVLITYLGQHNESAARTALEQIRFPTQTPAYYYAQAAWALGHNNHPEAQKWIKTAERVFPATANSWFARPLYELGWIKRKPPLACDQSI